MIRRAGELSEELAAHVVATPAHDIDVLDVRLHNDGCVIDASSTDPAPSTSPRAC